MYKAYVSCGVCLVLTSVAHAGYFKFDRQPATPNGPSVMTPGAPSSAAAPASPVPASPAPANPAPQPTAPAYVPGYDGSDIGTDNRHGNLGNCGCQTRSCCRNIWDSYCDDLPSCDRGCGKHARCGGFFSCQPSYTPTCCGPCLPKIRLPKLRMPKICLPKFPHWGRPVFGSSVCDSCIASDGCVDGACGGDGDAPAWPDQADGIVGEGAAQHPTPAPAAKPVAPAASPSVTPPPTAEPAAKPADQANNWEPAPPVSPPAAPEASLEEDPLDSQSLDDLPAEPNVPVKTAPVAPPAEVEPKAGAPESEDDLLESAQHRSILRSLRARLN